MPPIPEAPGSQRLPLQREGPVPIPFQPSPPGVFAPRRSPAGSDFGEGYHREDDTWVASLPPEVQDYLDRNGLEAHYVPADGNCLYRSLMFGPQWSKHHAARLATAGYMSGLRQNGNGLANAVDEEAIAYLRRNGNWDDANLGEPQLKAFAETFQVEVELTRAEHLSSQPTVYKPEPISDVHEDADVISDNSGSPQRPLQRILLYHQHYYPLVPKGSFPQLVISSSQHTAITALPRPAKSPQNEETKLERPISLGITDSLDNNNVDVNLGVNSGPKDYDNSVSVDEDSNKIIATQDGFNAVDKHWGIINAEQSSRLETAGPKLRNHLKPGHVDEKKLLLAASPKGKHVGSARSKTRVAGPLPSNRKVNEQVKVTGATVSGHAHVSGNPIAPFAIAAGVAAGLTGIFVLGAAAVNMFLGKRQKREPKKRKVDFTSE